MLDRIRSWFDAPPAGAAVSALTTERAVCVLLIAAARADGEFAGDEAREIARLVSGQFGLSAADTAELVTAAASEDIQDLFQVTRSLNERVDRAGRRRILELFWRVVFSDGRLEAREDALVHRVARLLDLAHSDLIAAKLAARRDREAP